MREEAGDNKPTEDNRPQPRIIWMNERGTEHEHFRIVDQGEPRGTKQTKSGSVIPVNDVRFKLEEARGFSAMRTKNWGGVATIGTALRKLTTSLGAIVTTLPGNLIQNHPIACEVNMAIIERRESRGCDCHRDVE